MNRAGLPSGGCGRTGHRILLSSGKGCRLSAPLPPYAGTITFPCTGSPPEANPGASHGIWWIVFGPELHLGADIVVPDLGGWRRDTMPEYPDTAYCTVAPDWACEVLSPSTRRIDRHEKSGIYAREGVSHLWLVDPDARTLEAFGLEDGRRVLLATLADGAPVSLPPFDAITFPLDALWPESAA